MNNLTPVTETLGEIAARQPILTDALRDALAKYGPELEVVSYTKHTPFGSYLIDWEIA